MEILLLIAFMILTIFAKLTIPPLLIRRAVKPVLERFIYFRALSEDNAKSIDELDLGPRSLTQRMVSLRDYKPKALDALMSASIVVPTEEGKLFLSREKLMSTPLLEKWPHLAERLRSVDAT
jgi:hypothetical protein